MRSRAATSSMFSLPSTLALTVLDRTASGVAVVCSPEVSAVAAIGFSMDTPTADTAPTGSNMTCSFVWQGDDGSGKAGSIQVRSCGLWIS